MPRRFGPQNVRATSNEIIMANGEHKYIIYGLPKRRKWIFPLKDCSFFSSWWWFFRVYVGSACVCVCSYRNNEDGDGIPRPRLVNAGMRCDCFEWRRRHLNFITYSWKHWFSSDDPYSPLGCVLTHSIPFNGHVMIRTIHFIHLQNDLHLPLITS